MKVVDDDTLPWQVTVTPESVHAWSRRRLAFEPSGAMVAYRNAIRRELANLDVSPGQSLVASYLGPNDDFVDVENAALYNIGSGAYSRLVGTGLYCERGRSPDGKHHLIYTVGALPDAPGGQTLLHVGVEAPHDVSKPGPWWAAFRPATVQQVTPSQVPATFAIDVALLGSWTSSEVANVVKPLLDGLIASLHRHDASGRDLLLPRMAELGDPGVVWDLLCDPRQGVLGTRTLLRPYRRGYAWNPADDRCYAFRFRTGPAPTRRVIAQLRTMTDTESVP